MVPSSVPCFDNSINIVVYNMNVFVIVGIGHKSTVPKKAAEKKIVVRRKGRRQEGEERRRRRQDCDGEGNVVKSLRVWYT
jgi:hypothetical protein